MTHIPYGAHLQIEGRLQSLLRRASVGCIQKESIEMGISRYKGYFHEGNRRMVILILDREDHDGDVPLDPVRYELDPEDAEKVVEALS